MFGLIYTGIVLACKAIRDVSDGITTAQSYQKAQENNKITYWTANGCQKYTDTGEPVYHATLNNGERVLKNNKGEVVHNFDRERRSQWLEEKQNMINKETDQIVLLGSMADVYPQKVIDEKRIQLSICERTAVYHYKQNNKNYVRERRFDSRLPKYIYVDIEDGMPDYLYQNATEEAHDWLEHRIHMNKEYAIQPYIPIQSYEGCI